ncbi:MAG: hypothetical protein PWQ77_1209 [Kosmotogales bacterium]|nr:hypothetical protein [Kosmotogales bacterium]
MKYEWRKMEKNFYLPKKKPGIIEIPKFNFFSVSGKGNPNNEFFKEYIGVLYSLSYAIRMSPKNGYAPDDYYEYTVFPLEGVWDISEEAKKNFSELNKDDFVFDMMIRQPDFVDETYAEKIIQITKKNKPHELLDEVKFVSIEEGKCVQMMHMGSYDSEPKSFKMMAEFTSEQGFKRSSKKHREIYLSDPRRANPEKLKTVLRFRIEEK